MKPTTKFTDERYREIVQLLLNTLSEYIQLNMDSGLYEDARILTNIRFGIWNNAVEYLGCKRKGNNNV